MKKFEDTITDVEVNDATSNTRVRVRGEFIVEEVFPPKKKDIFEELEIRRLGI